MADHYQTLGVDRGASPEDIKRAYRKLAAQHHPDRGGDTAKFQEIQAAYDVLGDSEKRSQYDNPPQQAFHGFGGMPQGFDDIFAQAFGGQNPFEQFFNRRQPHQPPQRNKTLNIQTSVSLEEAYHGKDLIASVTLPSGREQIIQVKIPAGIQDGTTLRLSGMGDDSINNVARGDINLTINVQPHNMFKRHGDDLVKDIEISAVDAMLGTSITVETIDNKLLEVNIPAGTQYGSTLSAQGYGMPNMNDNRFKGRFLINIRIYIPKDLNEEQKELLRKTFK